TQLGSTAERVVRETVAGGDALRREPLRVDAFRIVPEVGMAVRHVRTDEHLGVAAARDEVTPYFVVHPWRTCHQPDRRVVPQGFLNDHGGVGQPRNVLEHWDATTEHFRQLSM